MTLRWPATPHRPSLGLRLVLGLISGFTALLAYASPAAADIVYHYDALGRLRAVVDPASDTATYEYDSVGNLTAITRHPSSQVAIVEFHPGAGPIGSVVTVFGAGYSATASQNTVTFNGVAATVTAATATQLTATVPTGATTGPIAVTAPAGSATSAQPFTVTGSSGAPTITSFIPTVGVAGTSVSVSGGNFEAAPANNRLAFHLTRAQVSSATPTTLGTSVPPKATSGRLSVATPAGSATSTADFFVPPAPYVAADVVVADRMTLPGTKTVTIGTANRIGLVLFDGVAGRRVSLQASSVTIASSVVRVYTPQGTVLGPELPVGTSGAFWDVQTLPATGTYQILVDPNSTFTGSLTLTLYDVPADVTGSLTPGGAAVTVTTTAPGQNVRLTFEGTAGRQVSVKFTNVSASGSAPNAPYYAFLDRPDGTNLVPITSITVNSGGFMDSTLLPVTGTYVLRIDPQNNITGSLTVTAYDVVDLSGTITVGGPSVTVNATTPGQKARLTFSGSAGQRLGLNVTIGTLPVPGADISILNPDGTTLLAPVNVSPPSSAFLEPPLLPAAGTYTILADPRDAGTGSLTLALSQIPADVTASITPGGAAVTVNITKAGQNARLTFNGTAGQRISVRFTNVTIATSTVSLLKPDGTTLSTYGTLTTSGGFWDTQSLPTAGTYTILINPQGTATGSATVRLFNVPADVTGTLTVNGAALTVQITTPGQNGAVTFAGTAGQLVTVRVGSNTMTSLIVSLLNPAGATLASNGSGAASFTLPQQTLATTGTYTIRIDPLSFTTGSLNVRLTSP